FATRQQAAQSPRLAGFTVFKYYRRLFANSASGVRLLRMRLSGMVASFDALFGKFLSAFLAA
ncbi:MAG: hypothetical protein EBW47_11330, partial [Betaproteobacteria bacterium]|nr:hypothetical protein [Betaproteobacteria bacterium]